MGILPPTRPELFTPDLYPAGPALVPAPAPGVRMAQVIADLAAVSGDHTEDGAMHWHVDERLVHRVPDDHLRAGVAALAATVGAPLLDWLVADGCPVTSIAWGDPGGSRIAGLAQPADRPSHRVVNERYRHEHPFLATGSLLHQLCWNPDADDQAQEVLLHALLAVAHAQLLDRLPSLVGTTELARRQQSLVLSLLCSRPADRPSQVRIVAPDGAGTIPGGEPSMQTPDLWSIPFATDGGGVPARPTVAVVLGPWVHDEGSLRTVDRHLIDVVDAQALDRLLPTELVDRVLGLLGVPTAA